MGTSGGMANQWRGRGVSPAVLLMVCMSGADGVVSSLGHQHSLSVSHTSLLPYTSALLLELLLCTVTCPKHVNLCSSICCAVSVMTSFYLSSQVTSVDSEPEPAAMMRCRKCFRPYNDAQCKSYDFSTIDARWGQENEGEYQAEHFTLGKLGKDDSRCTPYHDAMSKRSL